MARRGRWPRYVTVAERREAAAQKARQLAADGHQVQPVSVTGTAIANTFWGKAWCKHLEQFSDYSNRLPRGRSYVRNGSVIHLEIKTGEIIALVGGSSTYRISISIQPLAADTWAALKTKCAGSISSALELLQGNISSNTMLAVCDRDNGLFPSPQEIQLSCDCPDWATLCKHLAAVLYGVGARLDESPELLFRLRGVDYEELIGVDLAIEMTSAESELTGDLSDIFGIEIDDSIDVNMELLQDTGSTSKRKKTLAKVRKKQNSKKKPAPKKTSHSKNLTKKIAKVNSAKKPLSSSEMINISRGIRASHIKALRKLHSLSVAEFAMLLNVSSTTISNWEHKAGVLNFQTVSRRSLEKAFSMTSKQVQQRLKRINN